RTARFLPPSFPLSSLLPQFAVGTQFQGKSRPPGGAFAPQTARLPRIDDLARAQTVSAEITPDRPHGCAGPALASSISPGGLSGSASFVESGAGPVPISAYMTIR